MFGTPAARRPYLLNDWLQVSKPPDFDFATTYSWWCLAQRTPFQIGRDGAPSPSVSRAGGAFVSKKTAITRLNVWDPAARRPYLFSDFLQTLHLSGKVDRNSDTRGSPRL